MENKTYSLDSEVNRFTDTASELVKETKSTLTEKAAALKEKTQEVGQRAINKIEESRVAAASALRGTASSLHESADKLPNGPAIAHSAARRVDSMADYLESRDSRQFIGDIGAVVKRNPLPSVAIAALAGFLIGRSLRRSE